MTLPLLRSLRAGPAAPQAVLLPDGLFFTRSLGIAAGSSLADVTAQVELALETLSPFPPAQLYHGFFWPTGANRALVFAAYRRRFTTEQLATWENAELVLPSFAALLGGNVKSGTTLVIPSDEGFTAIYWDDSPVPAKVVFRAVPTEANETERARIREQLTSATPDHRTVVLTASPAVTTSPSERELMFRAEAFTSRLPVTLAGALDVRDKTALASLRSARRRDVALWRGFLGVAATLLILGLGELALIGVGVWHKTRLAQLNTQRPVVERIMMAQTLSTRINELSTKRLLPFEMLDIVSNANAKPGSVIFQRLFTSGLYGLNVEVYTNTPADASAYQAALTALPSVQKVEIRDQRTRENVMNFTVAVTFRPDALKPANPAP